MLPKIEYPMFDVYLKSLNKRVKFRPFLVKEEKLLLMAKEASDLLTLLDTVKQIINNCALEPLDIDNLPLFDIEMIFIHLRLRSVGERLELTYKCENVVNEETCGGNMTFEVDLNTVEFKQSETHTNKIMINDKVGVVMNYPSLKTSGVVASNESSLEDIVQLIAQHINYIFDDTAKYDIGTIDEEELFEFLTSLSLDQVNMFRDFFETLPYVETQKDVKCDRCGYNHLIVVKGIDDFFG